MSKASEEWAKSKFGRIITEEELKRRTSPVWPYKYFKPGKPVHPEKVDELLEGVTDLHVHGAPLGAWLLGRPSMVETSIEASEAGMKALVFKDHNTMTNNVAIVIQEFLEEVKKEKAARGEDFKPVEVYGGIVLNETIGGLNSKAVEVALGYGRCREVWLPSLDAKHQKSAMGLKGGISITDGDGVVPELERIIDLIANYNKNSKGARCALSTCHVSNEEKILILDYIKANGIDVDVLMDHVTQELTIVTPEEAKEMIDKGAYLEFAECSCIPWPGMNDWIIAFDYSMDLIKELIKKKGAEHLVLITDAGQPGNKPVPGWKMFIKTLLTQDVSKRDIEVMAKKTPAKLLGLQKEKS